MCHKDKETRGESIIAGLENGDHGSGCSVSPSVRGPQMHGGQHLLLFQFFIFHMVSSSHICMTIGMLRKTLKSEPLFLIPKYLIDSSTFNL